jgi:hypothetical protein
MDSKDKKVKKQLSITPKFFYNILDHVVKLFAVVIYKCSLLGGVMMNICKLQQQKFYNMVQDVFPGGPRGST